VPLRSAWRKAGSPCKQIGFGSDALGTSNRFDAGGIGAFQQAAIDKEATLPGVVTSKVQPDRLGAVSYAQSSPAVRAEREESLVEGRRDGIHFPVQRDSIGQLDSDNFSE